MAVSKSKKSRAKRGTRRSHDKVTFLNISEDSTTGEKKIKHFITKEGYYRGEQII